MPVQSHQPFVPTAVTTAHVLHDDAPALPIAPTKPVAAPVTSTAPSGAPDDTWSDDETTAGAWDADDGAWPAETAALKPPVVVTGHALRE